MPRRLIAAARRGLAGLTGRWASNGSTSRPNPYGHKSGSHDGSNSTVSDLGPSGIIHALPDAAMVLDSSLTLIHGNALARGIFGHLRIGQHIALTTRNPELAAALIEAQSVKRRASFELHIRGSVERHLEGTVSILGGPDSKSDTRTTGTGASDDLLVILQDLSDRDALARTRVEFVANASHELRTPLTSLSGFIETLRGPAKDDPAARERFLAIMAEQASRMSRLIDDLLLLSRVEMRAHVSPTNVVDLNAVVADAVTPLSRLAASSHATLTCLPSRQEVLVRGDHDELVQVVQNLVQNALKYGKPNGTVTIGVTSGVGDRGNANWPTITVQDDGPGIPREHLPRLTERFYRVSTASSREKGGTGLGLAIVKHIVSRHHGKLDIESEVGTGSIFTVSMPALVADDARADVGS